MRIVVTGALGHIGSRLIRELPQHFADAEIVMLDDLSTQRFPSLFNLPKGGHYRFVECDVTKVDLAPFVQQVDVVVHLAALTDAAGSFGRREQVEQVNFTATQRVAAACLAHGVALIAPSSTSVYGTQKTLVDEDCDAGDLKPQSPYAETKLREEELLTGLAREGLRVAVLRLGTIFGTSPGMRFHTAINKFCWQAVMGTPLTIWTTAYDQRRPYLDLADAVGAVAFFVKNERFDGRIYNVVTENATVRQVVDRIRTHVPDLQESFVDQQIMNQLSYDVSNKRLSELGFRCSGDMERGIEDTIALLE
ncbi:MAG: SDR family oxidoreductase [Pseudolabrys sp.]|jgi:UDP-glucose 4-epimerase